MTSLAHLKQKSNLAALMVNETDAAAAEGRCLGRLNEGAVDFLAHLWETIDYLPHYERVQWWERVERNIEDGDLSLQFRAKLLIETKKAWYSGESVTVWQGGRCKAYVSEGGRDGGGLLMLEFRNGNPFNVARVRCGILSPLEGWRYALDDRQYNEWAKAARKLANN